MPMFLRPTSLLMGALAGSLLLGSSCSSPQPRLKILGEYDVVNRAKGTSDTVWATIPSFYFTDQNGRPFTKAAVANKIYVADFFFASCPTICPVVKKEEIRLWEKYRNDPRVVFVSHTIDPRHDSIPVLREYAERLGVANSNWYFVTGTKDSIYSMATRYLIAAQEDQGAAGGFSHSGALSLIDTKGRIRASISPRTGAPVYDGTVAADVTRLMRDVDLLLAEEFPSKKD